MYVLPPVSIRLVYLYKHTSIHMICMYTFLYSKQGKAGVHDIFLTAPRALLHIS